ncbi:MAG: hypothetical protein V2J12_02290 [Gammaproteobacteria bacterium]|jgi:hypothetical protein|nr:hypothetical protein [Gammaproteobacteria bacterium]
MNKQTQGRLILLAIAAAFILPIIAAVYLYFSPEGWRPGGYTQYGTLLRPPVTLPETPLLGDADAPVLREVWSMLVVAPASCDADCEAALVKIRQIRLALGPKMTRMQTVLLTRNPAILTPELQAEHPRLIITAPESAAAVLPLIPAYNNAEVFLVDPFGNLMMRYPSDADMGGIRKDLGQLLKLSTIG